MSIFDEFYRMQDLVNRTMGEFAGSLGGGGAPGGQGRRRGRGRRGSLGGFGGGLFDEDLFDMAPSMLLASSDIGGDVSGAGKQAEGKMEDVPQSGVGGIAETQLAQQQPQAGHLVPTFKPDQVLRARINVEEQPDKFIVTADVPGFSKENIKVNLTDDGLLQIKAEQSQQWKDQSKDKKYLKAERVFANMQRTIALPKGVEPSKISANYENGVLHVNLPKTEEKQRATQDIAVQ